MLLSYVGKIFTINATFDGLLDRRLENEAVFPDVDDPSELVLDLSRRSLVGQSCRLSDDRRKGNKEVVLVPSL